MNKSFTIYLLLLLFVTCTLNKRQQKHSFSSSSYRTFLIESKLKTKIGELLIHDWQTNENPIYTDSIIHLCEQLTLKSNHLFKHRTLSYVYRDIKDTINEKFHTTKAVLLGYYPKNFNGYEKARSEYLNRIDTSTVRTSKYIDFIDQNARLYQSNKIRNVDSTTLFLVDSLVDANNGEWLGFDKIGNNRFGITQNYFSHDIAIHHMEEEDNHRYFNLILKACKEGNEDWSCAEGIKWQQLRRFVGQPYTPYEYMKLRRLKISNNLLDVDDDETLMTINEISKLIREYSLYGKKAIIYPTILIKDKDYLLLGKSLMYELSQFDVEKEATFDSSILMPLDSLEKIGNDYPFVVKIVDK